MVLGHIVHRYQRGETQYRDLILAYAKHEQRLQVCIPYRTDAYYNSKRQIHLGISTVVDWVSLNSMSTAPHILVSGEDLRTYINLVSKFSLT